MARSQPIGVLDHDVLCEATEKGLEIALVPRAELARHGMVLIFGRRHTIRREAGR